MAGVSLSGDLKDPKRSIPRGTLAAVLTGFVVYLIVPVALAASADTAGSGRQHPHLVRHRHRAGPDHSGPVGRHPVVCRGQHSGSAQDTRGPGGRRRAVEGRQTNHRLVETLPPVSRPFHRRGTGGSALSAGLNAVAPVLTMFFLTTYGVINLVAGLELLSGSPFYRPSIKVPWVVSLVGALGCLWVMFLINEAAALAAVLLEILIYLTLRRKAIKASWGDVRYGALVSLARAVLLRLRNLPVAPQNWRPNILVFAGDVDRRADLVRLAAWLNQDRGLLTVSKVIVGSRQEFAGQVEVERREMDERLSAEGIAAFSEVEIVSALRGGSHCHRAGERHCGNQLEHDPVRLEREGGAAGEPAAHHARGEPDRQVHHHLSSSPAELGGAAAAHRCLVGRDAEQRGHAAATRLSGVSERASGGVRRSAFGVSPRAR